MCAGSTGRSCPRQQRRHRAAQAPLAHSERYADGNEDQDANTDRDEDRNADRDEDEDACTNGDQDGDR
jgi:thymidylate synthase ThyX